MPKLTLFADPMCSWCYGFSPVIQKLRLSLAQNFDFQLVMGGLRAEQQPINAAQRQQIQSHWMQVEKATGLAFDFVHSLPDGLIYNTYPACKAVAVLHRIEPSIAWDYLNALHIAFYQRGLDITDEGNLVEVAASLGLPEVSFEKALVSDDAERVLMEDLELTADNEANGFPSLLLEFNDYKRMIVVGYDTYENVLEKITNAIKRRG